MSRRQCDQILELEVTKFSPKVVLLKNRVFPKVDNNWTPCVIKNFANTFQKSPHLVTLVVVKFDHRLWPEKILCQKLLGPIPTYLILPTLNFFS